MKRFYFSWRKNNILTRSVGFGGGVCFCGLNFFFFSLLLKVYAALRDSQLWLYHKQEKCKCNCKAGGTSGQGQEMWWRQGVGS